MAQSIRSIWIEAEVWSPDDWDPLDANSDVAVDFADGERWVATFFTLKNIATLTAKNAQTGECLNGSYYCATDMILIDEISRQKIERVVTHLIEEGAFTRAFTGPLEADE